MIDTEQKAYLYGWLIASVDNEDTSKLINLITTNLSKPIFGWLIEFVKDSNEHSLSIPTDLSDLYTLVVVRGFVDCNASVDVDSDMIKCTLQHKNVDILKQIATLCSIPHRLGENTLTYDGVNCIDFLGKLYTSRSRITEVYQKYTDFLQHITKSPQLPQCHILKTDPKAILPHKARYSDAGYDLTIIKKHKALSSVVTLYDTCIKLKVQPGWYTEIVPRSSLCKSGYMLANSIGIIDASYNGNIYIALVKVDPDAPDISLPFRCCQLIFRRQVYVDIIESNEELDETSRGTGGFGSTGN